MAGRFTPFVKRVMVNAPDTNMRYRATLLNDLDHLAGGGSRQEEQLSLAAVEVENNADAAVLEM